MPNQPLYPLAKPIEGDVVVLCEGDAVGYDSALLKRWADAADLNGRFVKVMACGTGDALFGMADAIGRTIPVVVIEDRDFRTPAEAEKECLKKLKNRENRNCAMRGWMAWQRAEIENYFADDNVLVPVLAEAFSCDHDEVRNAVKRALSLLPTFQALEYALFRARKSWLSTDANRALRVETMSWGNGSLEALAHEVVREKLEKRLTKWQSSLHDGQAWEDPMSGDDLLRDFDTKIREWTGMEYNSDVWRVDWACKEVLKLTRQMMSEKRPGWWSAPHARNAPVNWGAFANDHDRDEHDRRIERELLPKFIGKVLEEYADGRTEHLASDFAKLAETLKAQ